MDQLQSNLLNKKFTNICRICLEECGIMLPIFKSSSPEIEGVLSVADKISSIAEVQINEGDGLPHLICQVCKLRIDKFYDFRVQVEISDRTLRSVLEAENPMLKMENNDYNNFINENISNEDLKLDVVMEPTDVDIEVEWKVCDVGKEEDIDYDHGILDNFEPYNHSEVELETILISPEKCLFEVAEQKTKVQRLKKCTYCGECFRDNRELLIHSQSHVTNNEENNLENEKTCELCFEKFSSLQNLKTHIQDHFCNSKLTNPDIVQTDKTKVKTIKKYCCSQCKKEFLSEEEYQDHIKKHKEKNTCGICKKVFTRMSSRKRHELSHVQKNFKCRQCGKNFQKKTELRYHVSCHVVSQPTCEICKKSFRNRQSLKMHMKRHTGESTYTCKTCGKAYFSNSELNRHVQIHLGKRDFPCPLCDQSFFSKPELTRHSKYHRGDKKFKCNVCSKSYFESGHLKIHYRIHTGEKPFICDFCSKAFISKSKLIRHQKIHFKFNTKSSELETKIIDTNL